MAAVCLCCEQHINILYVAFMFHIVKKNLPKVEAIPWKREFVGSWTSHPPDVSNEHDRAEQALLSSNERDVEDIETRVCTQEASNHDQLAQDLSLDMGNQHQLADGHDATNSEVRTRSPFAIRSLYGFHILYFHIKGYTISEFQG